MTDPTSTSRQPEDAADLALREGLRSNVLTSEALARIRSAAQAEWQLQFQQPAPRWRRLTAAVAAMAIGVMALGYFMTGAGTAGGAVLGEIARADVAGVAQVRWLRSDVSLPTGGQLRADNSFDFRGEALVSLAGGGNLRIARMSQVDVVAANTIRLKRGELYVDIPPGSRAPSSFVVATADGEFRHVGTQFSVAVVNGGTRLRVREGTVHYQGAHGSSTVAAGTEALVDRLGKLVQQPFATVGRDWTWAEDLAPDFNIEGRPLLEFLNWFSRESGRKLVLTDDLTRQRAATIRMHGSIHGLTTLEALSTVMAATQLQFELPLGEIRVSSVRVSSTSAK